MASELLVYLSGGPNKAHFKNPENGTVFKNKKLVQEYLSQIDPNIIFVAHATRSMDYVVYPDDEKMASPSSLRYGTPSLSLSKFIKLINKPKRNSKRTQSRVRFNLSNDDELSQTFKSLEIRCNQLESDNIRLKEDIQKLKYQIIN